METYENLVQRMKTAYKNQMGADVEDGSDTEIRIRVLAGELYSCMAAEDWLRKQRDPHTASGEQLDMLAAEKGVYRREALKAKGVLTFFMRQPSWYNITVPKGSVASLDGDPEHRYVTTEDAVMLINTSSVDIPAEAELAGSAGNAVSGAIGDVISAPSGIYGVSNTLAFTGGEDTESDEDLRRRLLQAMEYPMQGGSVSWYRNKAMQYPQVRSVSVVPMEDGPGTVSLYLDGRSDTLTDDVLGEIRSTLQKEREICVQLKVARSSRIVIPVKAVVYPEQGWSSARAVEACRKAVQKFFLHMEAGRKFTTASLAAAMIASGAVWNVVFDSTVTADEEIASDEAAVCGTILLEGAEE